LHHHVTVSPSSRIARGVKRTALVELEGRWLVVTFIDA
jgi:hypothetical protein